MQTENCKPIKMPDPKKLREMAGKQLIEKLNTGKWDVLVNWLESDNLDTVLISTSATHANIYQLRKRLQVNLSLFSQAIYDKDYIEICNKYTDIIFDIHVHDTRTNLDDKQVFEAHPKDFEFISIINPFKIIHEYSDGYKDVNDHKTDIMYDPHMLCKTISGIAMAASKLVDGCDNILDKLMIAKRLECIREYGLWNLVGGLTIEELGGL